MNTLLYILAYAIGGIMTAAGIYRFIGYRLRTRRCTGETTGAVVDMAEKRSLLSWPASYRYYPIFEYAVPEGGTEIRASVFPAQFKNQIDRDRRYNIRFDPSRPSVFLCPEWDKALTATAMGQFIFGIVILLITVFTALR